MPKNLTRLVSFVLYTGALAACGGQSTPTQPTSAPTKQTQSTVTTTPPPSTTPAPSPTPGVKPPPPPWVLSGPSDCVTDPTAKLQWTLTVNDAGAGIHLVMNTFHDQTAGCLTTQAEAFTGLAVTGPRDYAAGAAGETVFTFDPAQLPCGRAQVDVALNGTLIIGLVVNSGRDCASSPPLPPAPKPPTGPPPTPTEPGTPDICALTLELLDVVFANDGVYGHAVATVSWSSNATLGTLAWGDGKQENVSNGAQLPHTYFVTLTTTFTAALGVPGTGQCDALQAIVVDP